MRDQHSFALDKLLTSNTKITSLESQIRDYQKELLKSSHIVLSKDSQISLLKSQVERLGGDETSVVSLMKKEFEQELQVFKENIKVLEGEMMIEREEWKKQKELMETQIANISKEKV